MNLVDILDFNNPCKYELWRGKKLIYKGLTYNGVTNQGKNIMLDRMFNGGAQTTAWSIGLIDNAAFGSVQSSDTMASHSTWVEWQHVTGASRIAWGQGASAGQQVSNGSIITNDMTADGTLQGIFVADDSTLGGNTGVLWSTALFTVPLPCLASDTLKLTFAVQL